jgi:hypothetical protein
VKVKLEEVEEVERKKQDKIIKEIESRRWILD